MEHYKICENIGFCSGVRSAIWKSVLSLSPDKPTVIFGNLIHNERVLKEIAYNHIQLINDVASIPPDSRVIIPAHGITKSNEEKIRQITHDVVDMTCPVVVRLRKQLASLSDRGYHVILFGKRKHPEIIGAVSHAKPDYVHIIETVEELDGFEWSHSKWAVMSQTTANQDMFENMIAILQQKNLQELVIFRSLCPTVSDRQNSVEMLANESKVVLVVGDAKSSNTLSLYHKSAIVNSNTYLMETNHPYCLDSIMLSQIKAADQVGFLAGTSSPFYCIEEIIEKIALMSDTKKTFQPVLVLFGPTGVGKTETAEKLAETIQGEIINCDSMQIYRHLNIGTAKPVYPHPTVAYHMVDIVEPSQHYSVAEYRSSVQPKIRSILDQGKIPIIAGGSYLYLVSLIDGLFEMPLSEECKSIRRDLEMEAEQHNLQRLYHTLQEVDPEASLRISQQDKKRIVRALEVYYATRKPISQLQKENTTPLPYFFMKVGLLRNPEEIYQRIHLRTAKMMEDGLKQEIAYLYDHGYQPDIDYIKAHGYRELLQAHEGIITWEEAVIIMEKNTRHYVKRQLSWLRQRSDFHLVNANVGNTEDVVKVILSLLNDCKTWLGVD